MDDVLGPLEGMCVLGINLNESVNSLTKVLGRGGAQSSEGLAPQYAEPAFHLVEPRGVSRRVMEMDLGMLGQPSVVLGLMGIQVVKNNMKFSVGILSHGLVHEIQELPAAATPVVADSHQASSHFERGEKGRGAMPLVLVAKSPQSLPVGEAKPSLPCARSSA